MRLTRIDSNGIKRCYDIDLSNPDNMLGFGATGRVFEGYMVDESTGEVIEPVAIKFLYEDLSKTAIERARRESEIRIRHENLIQMKDFFETKDASGVHHYHVVSELLDGVMLLDFMNGDISNHEKETSDEIKDLYQTFLDDRNSFAIRITRELLTGIQALHENGYIHRDIDPSNVMLTMKGTVKLIDFGIAKSISSLKSNLNLTKLGSFIGKPKYAAPELVLGDLKNQNVTTDIYSVGIVLYQLLVGTPPFTGPDADVLQKHLTGKIPIKNIKDHKLRKIVEKATEKSQNDRYQTADEFIADLDAINTRIPALPKVSTTWLWIITGLIIILGFFFGFIGGYLF